MSNDDYEMMVAFCQLSERELEQEQKEQEEVDASDGTPIDGDPPIIAWDMMMMMEKNEKTPSQFSSRASNIEMFLVFLCCEITIY